VLTVRCLCWCCRQWWCADCALLVLLLVLVCAVFAYPGGASMEIHQALTRSETIDNILCRHEQVRTQQMLCFKEAAQLKRRTWQAVYAWCVCVCGRGGGVGVWGLRSVRGRRWQHGVGAPWGSTHVSALPLHCPSLLHALAEGGRQSHLVLIFGAVFVFVFWCCVCPCVAAACPCAG
jgi:hypothetical protein